MSENTVQETYDALYNGHCDEGLVRRIEARKRGEFSDEDLASIMEWRTAKSYADIIKLNCAFLVGEREFSPYHMGPPYAETTPAIPTLIRLHDYGILTTNSQPSKTVGPYWKQCNCCPKRSWFQSRQRAFLTFLIPSPGELITTTDLAMFLCRIGGDDRIVTVCFNGEATLDPLPEQWETHENRKADTPEGIADAEPACVPAINPEDPDAIVHFATDTNVMETVNPFLVSVLATSWDEDNLPGVVEQAAIASGLKRIFAS
ncbi:hypothetical protein LTR56_024974 [Elasticomyces elasticus]|nr:hypothetical protein LTR56_024974 [Elasticomyces elasticus]KAK3631036.1 hypothetical protein LTR22_021262 [Elasticomyces elasticus]KAK4917959.1 hypothetical protein LTR49_014234 [Elasticomyces elasticus]KAK5753355.1 hypothetical protein LTS12_016598 [Elasticomyces elasticus]